MFAATLPDGSPVEVKVSFWQCAKAGMGFTLGAGAVAFIATVLSWTIGLSLLAALGALMRVR